MATIGLDRLYYAPITEAETTGEETYGTPVMLAKAISAELSIELAEAVLHADDGPSEVVREFKGGKLTLDVDDIGLAVAEILTGATIDDKGVMVSSSEDVSKPVAVGFRARKSNGKFRYFWIYRIKFAVPSNSFATKGDSIAFQTPKIEGAIMRRNKPDGKGNHPWKVEITEGDQGVDAAVISGWYTTVYEPAYETVKEADE